MPFNEYEKQAVRAWAAHVPNKIPLVLEITRDLRSGVLQAFAEELSALAPQIAPDLVSRDTDNVPGFFLGHGWIWHAAPTGSELRPFLEILAVLGERSASAQEPARPPGAPSNLPVSKELTERLQHLRIPRELTVFTASQCPHCAHMLLELAPIPFIASHLVIRVIDANLFPESAHEAGIRSVPTVLFGKDFRWTGRTDIAHIFEVVCRNDHKGLSAAAAIRVLKEGKAGELACLMLVSAEPWSDFVEVLTHPDWSVRLGALVALEELSEKSPEKARAYLPALWERMHTLSTTVQGDVVYATGIVGDASWMGRVLQWSQDHTDDPQLQEAAEETLKKLKEARGC